MTVKSKIFNKNLDSGVKNVHKRVRTFLVWKRKSCSVIQSDHLGLVALCLQEAKARAYQLEMTHSLLILF